MSTLTINNNSIIISEPVYFDLQCSGGNGGSQDKEYCSATNILDFGSYTDYEGTLYVQLQRVSPIRTHEVNIFLVTSEGSYTMNGDTINSFETTDSVSIDASVYKNLKGWSSYSYEYKLNFYKSNDEQTYELLSTSSIIFRAS
mgnify:CR=1 FL=1